jgi:hypothetical protein
MQFGIVFKLLIWTEFAAKLVKCSFVQNFRYYQSFKFKKYIGPILKIWFSRTSIYFSLKEVTFTVEFRTLLSALCKTLCNLSPFTLLNYVLRQRGKNVYYITSYKVLTIELILRVPWNDGMKDGKYSVANVISTATTVERVCN